MLRGPATIVTAASLGLLFAGLLPAAPSEKGRIPLRNASFEDDKLGSRGQGWKFDVEQWAGDRHGVVIPPATMFPGGIAPEGQQLGFLSKPGSYMSQALPIVLQPEWRYTLQVFVGNRLETGFNDGTLQMQLYAGNELLATQSFRTPAKGRLVPVTLRFDSPASVEARGQLQVTLRNLDTRQINVDDVRFYAYPIADNVEPPALTWTNPDPMGDVIAVAGGAPPHPASAPLPEWETIGYWDYDGIDGEQLSNGLVLLDVPGTGLGQTWQRRLELKNHAQLRPRQRTLWPVLLGRADKTVCINYPDYPSYSAVIDLPGTEYDGVYTLGPCG